MRALIGVDRFKVHHVADDVVFVCYAIAAVHIAGFAGDGECLAAAVALAQADHFGGRFAVIEQAAEAEAAIRTLIRWTGDDPDREGLLDTPSRVARSYLEF